LFVVVLCTQCCQCLWMVCLSSSCVPNVASVSDWQHWVHKTTTNKQSRDTGNIGYTRRPQQIIQRHWQHWVHKDCLFVVVLCTQCCQCLWVVCLSSSYVLNVASVSGWFVCRRLMYSMLPVSLDGLLVVV
jgi:hypothetical protein